MFLKLSIKSLLSRRGSVLLTLVAMSVSVLVILGVEHIRHQAKVSFASTVSGVDMVVGAKTGSLNLLLYSVFRIGAPTNNISWEAYEDLASRSEVKWAVPISLGDSHNGFRVLGTTTQYFDHYRYGKKHPLEFRQGERFEGVFDVVLGAQVASKLNYDLGDQIVLAHGTGATSFSMHDQHPFKIVGILKPTGTPVDQTVHVSLQGIEAIHHNWGEGKPKPSTELSEEQLRALKPESITAALLGLNSRLQVFGVQRDINQKRGEPLLAILPGIVLSELWAMMGVLENTLRLVSFLVFISAAFGLSAMMLASMRERAKEIELLRVMGASPLFIFIFIELEALLLSLSSMLCASAILYFGLLLLDDFLIQQFGLHIDRNILTLDSLIMLGVLLLATIVAASIPAFSAYRVARSPS